MLLERHITGALKSPFNDGNMLILITFACGSLTGVLGFGRVLNWFLKNHREVTMAFLTGILIGSMKKVWPWKEVLETKIVRGKTKILQEANFIPEVFDGEVVMAASLIALSFIGVLFIESRRTPKNMA